MQHDDLVYAGQMLDLARKAIAKVEGLDRNDYDRDENLRLALTHILQTVGEAARHVSAAFSNAHPDVPWTKIVGMRHRIVHDYLDVDEDLVWVVVTRDLPPLVRALSAFVPPLPEEP